MPNYNTPLRYLKKAVDSILKQTYENFEFIIVDDCSTDESYTFLRSLKDPRIHLVRNEENKGVTASLNVGFRLAKGIYIARMDSDDVSYPTRFERQIAFMRENPDVIVCGTFAEEIGDSHFKRCRQIPGQKLYQCGVLFGNVYGLIHPTALFRADELKKNDIIYDENIKTAQDYAMWATCCRYGRIANIEEILFQYRIHKNQISSAKKKSQEECVIYTMKRQLINIMPQISEAQVALHYEYCTTNRIDKEMREWFKLLASENQKVNYVDSLQLEYFLKNFLRFKTYILSRNIRTLKEVCFLFLNAPISCWSVIFKNILVRVLRRCQSTK